TSADDRVDMRVPHAKDLRHVATKHLIGNVKWRPALKILFGKSFRFLRGFAAIGIVTDCLGAAPSPSAP
ncbi:hypothetical protein, partial [Methylobacterium sp. Leaf469]|uniref:hypothetical protein n=1 Tax=Methylobacterium sp. Leaf469 TaxID=1736387 RepID=UPI001FCD5E3B